MPSRTTLKTVDHIDPTNGILVCGLDVPLNINHTTHIYNARKQNRFVPYRVDLFPPPQYFGDVCEFLIDDEWVVCEFGGEQWWTQSSKNGCGSTHSNRGYKTGKLTEETVDGMRKRAQKQGYINIENGSLDKSRLMSNLKTRKPVLVTRLSDGHVFMCPTRSDACKQFKFHPRLLIECVEGKREQYKGYTICAFDGEV